MQALLEHQVCQFSLFDAQPRAACFRQAVPKESSPTYAEWLSPRGEGVHRHCRRAAGRENEGDGGGGGGCGGRKGVPAGLRSPMQVAQRHTGRWSMHRVLGSKHRFLCSTRCTMPCFACHSCCTKHKPSCIMQGRHGTPQRMTMSTSWRSIMALHAAVLG